MLGLLLSRSERSLVEGLCSALLVIKGRGGVTKEGAGTRGVKGCQARQPARGCYYGLGEEVLPPGWLVVEGEGNTA